MAGLVVDVLFRDRVVATVPFDRPTLRVGRMPDNDVVIDNLAVSRSHARLHLHRGRVFLEDTESDNGCLVNGQRISGRCEVAPGAIIEIGKHTLRIRRADTDERIERPAARAADAWDGARTHLFGAPVLRGPELQPDVAAPVEAIQTEGVSQLPPEEIPAMGGASVGEAHSGVDAMAIDFGFEGTLTDDVDAAPAAAPRPDQTGRPGAPLKPLHPGLIVQHQGRLLRVVPWTGEFLIAGRSSECQVLLEQEEVSRRHARFERFDDRFEIRDLGSVNGTFVNGRRIESAELRVGDVIQIEGFQLTFVLEREPLEGMIATAPAAPRAARPEQFGMTMLQEAMPPPAEPSGEPMAMGGAPAPVVPAAGELPDGDLFADELEGVVALEEEDVEKPSEDDSEAASPASVRGSSRATSVQDLSRISQPNLGAAGRSLRLELRVRAELLPPALREAFEQAGTTELVLPAELRLIL